jgi:hypothetical protein
VRRFSQKEMTIELLWLQPFNEMDVVDISIMATKQIVKLQSWDLLLDFLKYKS